MLEKKEKANLVTPTEQNEHIRDRLVKRKNTVIAAKLQVQKMLNTK